MLSSSSFWQQLNLPACEPYEALLEHWVCVSNELNQLQRSRAQFHSRNGALYTSLFFRCRVLRLTLRALIAHKALWHHCLSCALCMQIWRLIDRAVLERASSGANAHDAPTKDLAKATSPH